MSPHAAAAVLTLVALAAPGAAAGAEPIAVDRGDDERLVIARTVMPRVAYRALEPTANPVRVETTTFPGRIFHSAIGDFVGQLVGEEQLAERPSMVRAEDGPGVPMFTGPLADGPAARGPGMAAPPLGGGVSIGGSVLRATSDMGALVERSVLRAVQPGGGG